MFMGPLRVAQRQQPTQQIVCHDQMVPFFCLHPFFAVVNLDHVFLLISSCVVVNEFNVKISFPMKGTSVDTCVEHTKICNKRSNEVFVTVAALYK